MESMLDTSILDDIIQDEIKPILIDTDNCLNIKTENKQISILHLNIRSIKKNFNEFLAFIESYGLVYCDVIILGEAWNVENPKYFNIPGYQTHYNESKINKNDGVFIYVRSNLNADVKHIKLINTNLTISKISFTVDRVTYGINALYRSPSNNFELFLEDLESFFMGGLSAQTEVFIGDINVDLKKESRLSLDYSTLLNHHGFVSHMNQTTRENNISHSCIDHIFLRCKLKKSSYKYQSYIIHANITDHYPIMLNINNNNVSEKNTPLENYEISRIDYTKLNNLLELENWDRIYSSECPELATQRFVETFLDYMERSKIVKVFKKNIKKIKPWITLAKINSIKHRDKLKKN